ncbi:hypothetical protein CUR95_24810 [Bordetella bronchiseptica]|nr:hypothetical protein [Bordetella bronchiseptica]
MGRPGGKKRPPRCARYAGLLPPRGGFFALGRPGGKKRPPRCARYAGLLPPEGAFLPWGGPAAKRTPTLRPLCGLAAPEGAFCLGAARRQKKSSLWELEKAGLAQRSNPAGDGCQALMSLSLVSRTNSVPMTRVMTAMMIGYHRPS